MEKSFNIKVEELKERLFEIINNSDLPFSSVYYLFKDFMQDLTNAYTENLNNEYQQYQEEIKKKRVTTDNKNEKNSGQEE